MSQQVRHPTARVEHEASTSKIGEDQLFYFQQRGIPMEEAVAMIISGAVSCYGTNGDPCLLQLMHI